MELTSALRTTSTTRAFEPTPVPDEVVLRILETARFAPSGGNQQPWHVVIVKDAQTRAAIEEFNRLGLREYVAPQSAGQRAFGLSARGRWPGAGEVDLEAARRSAAPRRRIVDDFGRPPVLLVVLVELGKLAATDVELDRHGIAGGASIYPFCWQIVLAARAEGLGGAMTTIAVRFEPDIPALVGAPAGWAVAAVVALGYAQAQPKHLARKPVHAFTSVDRFAGPVSLA